jgi:transcriptional regulator with XRE-family HTH domain
MEIKYAEIYKKIGKNISEYRKKNKLSQEELANLVGISYSYVTQIEAPGVVKKMSLEVLLDIASVLNVDIKDLLK